MKKSMFKALLAAVAMSTALSAQAIGPDVFNHLGVNAQVGTNGITLEAATKLTRFVDVRAGVDMMPGFKIKSDAEYTVESMHLDNLGYSGPAYGGTIDLEGSMKRTQGHILFNVYPIPGASLFVVAGGYFGGNKLLKISGHADISQYQNAGVLIGDWRLPVDKDGNVNGGLKVNSFRPYLGLGFGRAVPNHLLNFGFELGVQIQGKPKVYSEDGDVDTSVLEDDNTYNKIMKYLKVYPTISFKLQFRAL